LTSGVDAIRVAEHFTKAFGHTPSVVANAPGRVNLIGEHTDYNGGFVLPMAIPQRTWVAVAKGEGLRVRASSANLGAGDRVREYTLGGETQAHGWLDYVQGVTQALASDGHRLSGFDLSVCSDVPLGSGLSSSAALEVGVMRALRDLFALALDDVRLAALGQKAENEFVGAPVGIMDQMAASLADDHTALFLDTRSLQYEQVPLPAAAALAVINSGVSHNHASGDYRTRRAECERAAAALGVPQLRDVTLADLPRLALLPDPISRRARHVVTENARVLQAVAAMKAADLRKLGALFYASHVSQRDDFEVSVPEVDLLVELAQAEPGVHGARLTGGGFGGSIVALVERDAVRGVAERVAAGYSARTGKQPSILVPQLG
jgi:galactokinase